MNINIFYDQVSFRLKGKAKILELIKKVIRSEKKIPGDLNIIITNDDSLLSINREFLKHNYFTDVIAFDYSSGKIVSGEIYVSFDTIKRNASNYKVSLKKEFLRVIIHGTLHLCGYNDSNSVEKDNMHKLEDKWIIEYERIVL